MHEASTASASLVPGRSLAIRLTWFMALMVSGAAVSAIPESAGSHWAPIWVRTIGRVAPFQDSSVHQVVIAPSGAVFVSTSIASGAALLTQLDGAGNIVWSVPHPSPAGVVIVDEDRIVLGGQTLRMIDRATGALLWQSGVNGTPRGITLDANGNVLLLATDGGDFVVHRWTPGGVFLSTWRVPVGSADSIEANAIVAYPGGGAVITGRGNVLGGGYVTARFDDHGDLMFRHVELGNHGHPLGPAFVALDAQGNINVAGAPESAFGVAHARIWKLSPAGDVIGRWLAPQADPLDWKSVQNMTLDGNGDIRLLIGEICTHRLVRVHASLDRMTADTGSLPGQPIGVAHAPGGHSLISADTAGCGPGVGRLVELDESGRSCRMLERADLRAILPASSAQGWVLAGITPFVASSGTDAVIELHEARIDCDAAGAFLDGFEG